MSGVRGNWRRDSFDSVDLPSGSKLPARRRMHTNEKQTIDETSRKRIAGDRMPLLFCQARSLTYVFVRLTPELLTPSSCPASPAESFEKTSYR